LRFSMMNAKSVALHFSLQKTKMSKRSDLHITSCLSFWLSSRHSCSRVKQKTTRKNKPCNFSGSSDAAKTPSQQSWDAHAFIVACCKSPHTNSTKSFASWSLSSHVTTGPTPTITPHGPFVTYGAQHFERNMNATNDTRS
jgi:hypothetical protein